MKKSPEDWKVAEIGCPTCAGALRVRNDGKHRHREYACYVGHRFSSRSLLHATEAQLEYVLWSAIATLEHIERICQELLKETKSGKQPRSSKRVMASASCRIRANPRCRSCR